MMYTCYNIDDIAHSTNHIPLFITMIKQVINCTLIVEKDSHGVFNAVVEPLDQQDVNDINKGLANNYKIANMVAECYGTISMSSDMSTFIEHIRKQIEDAKETEINNRIAAVGMQWSARVEELNSQLAQANAKCETTAMSLDNEIERNVELMRVKNEVVVSEVKAEYERQLAEMRTKLAVRDEAAKSKIQPTIVEHQKECARLQHTIDEMSYRIQQLQKYKDIDGIVEQRMKGINDLVKSTDNNQLGESGETLVYDYIRERMEISGGSVERVNGLANHGDMVLRLGELTTCIEIKNHTDAVSMFHINRFKHTDLQREEYNSGLFISIKSGFVQKSNIRDFTIEVIHGKPTVFIAAAVNNMKAIVSAIKVLTYIVDKQQQQGQDIEVYIQKINQVITSIQTIKEQISVQKKSTRELEQVVSNMEETLTGKKKREHKYVCEGCQQGFNLKRELKAHTC